MKLVVDLPDNMIKMCGWHKVGICELTDLEVNMLAEAIDKGKPLPSDCEKLIDAEVIVKSDKTESEEEDGRES